MDTIETLRAQLAVANEQRDRAYDTIDELQEDIEGLEQDLNCQARDLRALGE